MVATTSNNLASKGSDGTEKPTDHSDGLLPELASSWRGCHQSGCHFWKKGQRRCWKGRLGPWSFVRLRRFYFILIQTNVSLQEDKQTLLLCFHMCSYPYVQPRMLKVKMQEDRISNIVQRFIQVLVHKLRFFFKFSYSQLLLLALLF